MTHAHRSPYAGSWYPDDPVQLGELLARVFEESRRRTGPALLEGGLAFVVPHAAPMYSGFVAASVYKHLKHQGARRVVILAFSHSRLHRGVLVPRLDAYETPLGRCEVDTAAVRQLTQDRSCQGVPESEACDHSLEIQLPFLQRELPEARVVPVYVGEMSPDDRVGAAHGLASLLEPGTVFLASSDLTHYGRNFHYTPFPPGEDVALRLQELDEALMDAAGSLNGEFFLEEILKRRSTLCGRGPIRLLLEVLRHAPTTTEVFQTVLDYQTSGELTGDYSHSVSYGALGYYPVESFWLNEREQEALLGSARRTLHNIQAGSREPEPAAAAASLGLQRRSGVFVSLHQQGQLRGCIGCRSTRVPLAAAVSDYTRAAALHDPRFAPLGPGEPDCDIEISILSPMKRMAPGDHLETGVHGASIEARDRSALLLPQVADKRHWSEGDFLAALAMKAGLDKSIYSDPETGLWRFRAQVFGAAPPAAVAGGAASSKGAHR